MCSIKSLAKKIIKTQTLATYGLINIPGNPKTAHEVLPVADDDGILKKQKILECRTNIGSGEEFQICEEGLRPSHRHKAQLAILRNIPEKNRAAFMMLLERR